MVDTGNDGRIRSADPALALRAEPDGLGADALRSVAQHTPGPWFVDGDEITNAQGAITIAIIPPALDARECVANARLIAAAPDLLEALRECLREHGGFTIWGDCETRALAAIASAEGR